MAKYPRQMERFFGSSYAAVSRLYYAMQGTLNVADDSELPTYDAKQLLRTYKKDGILIFTDEASALMTEGSMASGAARSWISRNTARTRTRSASAPLAQSRHLEQRRQLHARRYRDRLGRRQPDRVPGQRRPARKDMLLALDGEELTENCLLKDTDTPWPSRCKTVCTG